MRMFLYRPGDSLMHRADAVSKLVWLLCVTATALLISTPYEAAVLLILVLFVGIVLGGIPTVALIRRLGYLATIAGWLFAFLAITYPEGKNVVAEMGPLDVTTESLRYASALALRILVFGGTTAVFAFTTDPRRMISELISFARLPYRFGFALYSALRFIPLLQAEAATIMNAHAVRGDVGSSSGRFRRLLSLRRLTIPLLAGAIRRVQITAIAMDSRGFGAFKTRTALDPLTRAPGGLVLAGLHLALLLLTIWWRVFLGGGEVIRPPVAGLIF